MVVVNHRWQSESSDGPQSGWNDVSGVVALVAVVTSPELLDVVWCSAVAVVDTVVKRVV